MKQETSSGAVVYKKENNEYFFLLVYSVKNKEWSFPKGHIEKGETELETAKREILSLKERQDEHSERIGRTEDKIYDLETEFKDY